MNKITHTVLALLLAFTAFGFQDCGGKKQNTDARTAEERKADQQKQIVKVVAASLDTAATALESGITTVRSLRRAGNVKPEDALRMARIGQSGNAVALAGARNILQMDEIGGGDVVTLIESLVATGQRLSSEGVLVINGRSQIIFAGVTTGSIIFLRSQGDELRKLIGEGGDLKLKLDGDSRRKLERAVKTMERNAREFDASIAELSR